MQENKITVADLITQAIDCGQLSDEEEAAIKRMIEEKQKRKEDKKYRCLAGEVESEMIKKLDPEDRKMMDIYQSVLKKCYKETCVGNMDALKLSEEIVDMFEREIRKTCGLSKREEIFFMGMLQVGLNKLSGEGALNFTPDRDMFKNFMNLRQEISYIENPYSESETEKIVKWVEAHPADIRGLAINLWFSGGISLTEIVNLTKKDCWNGAKKGDSIMKFDRNLFKVSSRSQIVWNSLRQHPKSVECVFAIPNSDKSGWKKLTELGLQRKLCCICQDIGINYKSIRKNEVIKLGR